MARLKLKWLIAHHPQYLFVRTAKKFRDELEKRCPGEFDIEILTMKDYLEKYNEVPELNLKVHSLNGLEKHWETYKHSNAKDIFKPAAWSEIKKKWKAYFSALQDGRIDISQTQITVIGLHLFKPFAALDLPFLFRDHDHVTKSLDGKVGKSLRKLIENKTGIKSLGFTYSGGYRIIGSNHDIENIIDLKDTPIQTVPTTTAMWNEYGSKAFRRIELDIEETKDFANKKSAIETTYLRFNGTNILKTNHSMFLTSILTGSSLFDKLTSIQQKAFEESAFAVSKIERKWSLEDCEKYEKEAESKGIQIREISEEERQILQDNSYKAYNSFYENQHPNGLDGKKTDEQTYNNRKRIVDNIKKL